MSHKISVEITGWKYGFNKMLLTKFLAQEINIKGQGHVVYRLLRENRPIRFEIEKDDMHRVSKLLTEWNAVFCMEAVQ